MNHDLHLSAETDDDVSAGYRAVAAESAPAHLDQRVLRQAAAAAESKWFEKYSITFLRPLTFVATLGLSLAIVLQISEMWRVGPVVQETELAQHGAVSTQESLHNKPPLIAGAEVQRTEAARYCEAAQSESADTWWDCIVQLELDGRRDAAADERELFIRTFPDFERR